SLKAMLQLLASNCGGDKAAISLGLGDPTAHSCFATDFTTTDAVSDALLSWKFNGYAPTAGLTQTREAIAEYLSKDLPKKLSQEDVFITAGCTQAIELTVSILARRDANILLPRPGFPIYGLCASFRGLEARYFDLDPERGWEVDLDCVERLADGNTVAMVVINPGNPCGNVYGYDHLKQIAETARKLGITVISDEVYGHLTFGTTPFVSMGTFGDVAP
ncbi:aminotransferase family protein, partial [Genlisea aurea]